MKAYKKGMIGAVLAAVFCFSPVCAFAAEAPVEITSGLEVTEDEVECTFEDSRIVYGEATPDTAITFTISCIDRHGDLQEVYADSLTVGSLGLFSVTLPLEMGYNYITMTADAAAYEEAETEYVIKRVPQQVKQQLQQMIALPGLQAAR